MRGGLCSLSAIVCTLLNGCSGDGTGLDANGQPISDVQPPPVSAFRTIQETVFTPFCVTCHAGASAPLGLRLEEGVAYAALVNAPSSQVPSRLRVQPGSPDSSYLVHKIEGRSAAGVRMPLGGAPLPQASIDLIRQWIQDGAQPAAMTALPGAVTLKPVIPAEEALVAASPVAIVITADAELDTSLLTTANVKLLRSGGDDSFAEGNEVPIGSIEIAVRSLEPTVFVITLPAAEWVPERYLLSVAGSGPAPVADRGAIPIDGDGNGSPGGDFEFSFEVTDETEVTP
jgi:hypothetical protein